MQHLCLKVLKNFYFYYFMMNFYKLMVHATITPKAIEKNQIALGNFKQFKIQVIEEDERPVLKNFDIKPNKTILENDGRSLVIQMIYDMDKRYWPIFSIYNVDFYFEYMYFQWLENVPKRFTSENIAFHGELHAVFYEGLYEDFAEALAFDGIAVLAFSVKVNPFAINKYVELQENLKMIQQPYMPTVIKNMPLAYWLNASLEHYCAITGSISLLSSPTSVIWLDVGEPIEMTPEIVSEFQHLQTVDGKPLMNQFLPVTMNEIFKIHVCNYKPYEELEIENGSKRFEVILALIIFAQMAVIMAFGLP